MGCQLEGTEGTGVTDGTEVFWLLLDKYKNKNTLFTHVPSAPSFLPLPPRQIPIPHIHDLLPFHNHIVSAPELDKLEQEIERKNDPPHQPQSPHRQKLDGFDAADGQDKSCDPEPEPGSRPAGRKGAGSGVSNPGTP